MFYTYTQNNSGGRWVFNDMVTQYVIIEARNAAHANKLAEVLGIYFDGGGDCECCGYRWSEADDAYTYDVHVEPVIYSKHPGQYYDQSFSLDWVKDKSQAYCYVYYMDGRKTGYFRDPESGVVFSDSI